MSCPRHCLVLSLTAAFLLAPACYSPPERTPLPGNLRAVAGIPGIETARYWGDEPPPLAAQVLGMSPEELRAMLSGIIGIRHDYLAISGGGQNGAFGAGLLCGWTEEGSRPEFAFVTGVSTGALIAPFAFLGPDYDDDLKTIYTQYGTDDLVKKRGLIKTLRSDAASDTAPLRTLIAKHYPQEVLDRIGAENEGGRNLLIGTTDLDSMRPVIWSIGRIARSGSPARLALFHDVLLASASIPVAFPPVVIEVEAEGHEYDEMHVDGGAAAQVFLYPPGLDWREILERLEVVGTPRVFVIRNAFLDPKWQATERKLASIAVRSIDALLRSQGIGDLYRIYLESRRDGVEFNLAQVPADFAFEAHEEFDVDYMRALFQRGYEMARDGYPWKKAPPGFEQDPL